MTNGKDNKDWPKGEYEWDFNKPSHPATDEEMFELFHESGWDFKKDPDMQKKFEAWKAKNNLK
jgi:hypothetical protein